MRNTFLFISLFLTLHSASQSKNELAVRRVLENQSNAWNSGDIDGFMKGYWENDSLMFIGRTGVTYGWTNTLSNYKKGYPDTATMGKLTFTLLQVKKFSKKFYHVTGKWFLKRSIGDVGGYFTLVFQKINGRWVIISDHTS